MTTILNTILYFIVFHDTVQSMINVLFLLLLQFRIVLPLLSTIITLLLLLNGMKYYLCVVLRSEM